MKKGPWMETPAPLFPFMEGAPPFPAPSPGTPLYMLSPPLFSLSLHQDACRAGPRAHGLSPAPPSRQGP